MSTANVILPFFVGEGEPLFVLLPSKKLLHELRHTCSCGAAMMRLNGQLSASADQMCVYVPSDALRALACAALALVLIVLPDQAHAGAGEGAEVGVGAGAGGELEYAKWLRSEFGARQPVAVDAALKALSTLSRKRNRLGPALVHSAGAFVGDKAQIPKVLYTVNFI